MSRKQHFHISVSDSSTKAYHVVTVKEKFAIELT